MSVSFPPSQLNNLICNLEFEKSHRIFANCIAHKFSGYVQESIAADYAWADYQAPCESESEMWSIDLDITKRTGLMAVQFFTKSCEYLQPFYTWMDDSSKVSTLSNNTSEYLQDKMLRVGILAEKKLKELLTVYSSHPMRTTYQFHVELDRKELQLQVKFWIDLTNQRSKL